MQIVIMNSSYTKNDNNDLIKQLKYRFPHRRTLNEHDKKVAAQRFEGGLTCFKHLVW